MSARHHNYATHHVSCVSQEYPAALNVSGPEGIRCRNKGHPGYPIEKWNQEISNRANGIVGAGNRLVPILAAIEMGRLTKYSDSTP